MKFNKLFYVLLLMCGIQLCQAGNGCFFVKLNNKLFSDVMVTTEYDPRIFDSYITKDTLIRANSVDNTFKFCGDPVKIYNTYPSTHYSQIRFTVNGSDNYKFSLDIYYIEAGDKYGVSLTNNAEFNSAVIGNYVDVICGINHEPCPNYKTLPMWDGTYYVDPVISINSGFHHVYFNNTSGSPITVEPKENQCITEITPKTLLTIDPNKKRDWLILDKYTGNCKNYDKSVTFNVDSGNVIMWKSEKYSDEIWPGSWLELTNSMPFYSFTSICGKDQKDCFGSGSKVKEDHYYDTIINVAKKIAHTVTFYNNTNSTVRVERIVAGDTCIKDYGGSKLATILKGGSNTWDMLYDDSGECQTKGQVAMFKVNKEDTILWNRFVSNNLVQVAPYPSADNPIMKYNATCNGSFCYGESDSIPVAENTAQNGTFDTYISISPHKQTQR